MKTRKQLRSKRPAKRAFTLMEIIVVVTIIALLAAVIAPRLMSQIPKARITTAGSGAKAIATAVQLYLIDTGTLINDGFELDLLLDAAEDGGGSSGPYLDNSDKLLDPWDNAYVIRVPGEKNYDFDIVSLGLDGQFGTEDDITN